MKILHPSGDIMAKDNGNLQSLKQSQRAKRSSVAEWRASRLHEETLPSGLPVVLRDVDLASIFVDGDIPNTMIDLITSPELEGMSNEEVGKKFISEDSSNFNTLLKALAKAALAEPQIGETADNTHILYSELSFEDKMFIFNFTNRDANAVRPFREGTAEPAKTA
jgi:hypothetical protein